MNEAHKLIKLINDTCPSNAVSGFLLKYGREYQIGPESFAGRRRRQGECYRNASCLAVQDHDLTYVEGVMTVRSIPVEHAWCVRGDVVVDPTVRQPTDEINDYFGIPFKTEYVIVAAVWNNCYGLLDVMYSRKTLPMLIELGLEEGQQWLIEA